MKATNILASTAIALAAMAGSSAFAQTYSPVQQGVPTTYERGDSLEVVTGGQKSRAEVRAELNQAGADPALDTSSERLGYDFEDVNSTKSRSAVMADVMQAKKSGSMALPGTARTPFGTTNPNFPRS
jgi:hypothetical protein